MRDVCLISKGKTITRVTATAGDVPVIGGGLRPTYFHNVANCKAPVITISASGANAGFVNFWNVPIWASDCTTIVELSESPALIRYIYKFLQSKQEFINTELRRGSAQPHVYPSDIADLEINLPTLGKQIEIVEKLDYAFLEIEQLESNIRKSEEKINHLALSLLNQVFSVDGNHGDSILDFSKVFKVVSDSNSKVKSSSYLESGKYAVVDQGKGLIAGYTNSVPTVEENHLPVIVFGDHTRAVKYINFPFAAGADGTQILKTSSLTNPKFGFYMVLHAASVIPSKGYARHFGELKKMKCFLPPLEQQLNIVEMLDSAFTEIELLRSNLRSIREAGSALRQSILHKAFSLKEVSAE